MDIIWSHRKSKVKINAVSIVFRELKYNGGSLLKEGTLERWAEFRGQGLNEPLKGAVL